MTFFGKDSFFPGQLQWKVRKTAKKSEQGVVIMKENLDSAKIQQLLADADELIQKINSDFTKDMKEERLIEFEQYTRNLEKIKSEVESQSRIEKKGAWEPGSASEGTHEAIQDIVKAMRGLTKYLS